MNDKILELIQSCHNSSFSKNNYSVTIDFDTFIDSMVFHTWSDNKRDNKLSQDDKVYNKNWLKKVTPKFQRANNKWNKSMKQKFIENLLSGVRIELMLFRLKDYDDAQIIDGLQRTTAIMDFFNGIIKPFGYSYSDLKSNLRKFTRCNLRIKIYTFSSWEEVGRFYIDMNENITHSKKDIQKAKDWFLAEHNIEL